MNPLRPHILDDAATWEYQRLDPIWKILDSWNGEYLHALGVSPG